MVFLVFDYNVFGLYFGEIFLLSIVVYYLMFAILQERLRLWVLTFHIWEQKTESYSENKENKVKLKQNHGQNRSIEL